MNTSNHNQFDLLLSCDDFIQFHNCVRLLDLVQHLPERWPHVLSREFAVREVAGKNSAGDIQFILIFSLASRSSTARQCPYKLNQA